MNPQPSDEELKKTWRENWLSSINELTSLDLQKRSWLDKKTPIHTGLLWSSFAAILPEAEKKILLEEVDHLDYLI